MSNQFKGLCANPFMFDYYHQQWSVSPCLLHPPVCILPICITSIVLYQALFVLPFLSPCITLSTSIATSDPHNGRGVQI